MLGSHGQSPIITRETDMFGTIYGAIMTGYNVQSYICLQITNEDKIIHRTQLGKKILYFFLANIGGLRTIIAILRKYWKLLRNSWWYNPQSNIWCWQYNIVKYLAILVNIIEYCPIFDTIFQYSTHFNIPHQCQRSAWIFMDILLFWNFLFS